MPLSRTSPNQEADNSLPTTHFPPPTVHLHIGDYLGRRAVYSPNKLAIIDMGHDPVLRLTYADLNGRANTLANWLQKEAGIRKSGRVAILARDGVAHLDCFFACAKLGAIHTALNWRLHWRELAKILTVTTPQVLIYSDDFRECVLQIQRDTSSKSLTHFIHLEGQGLPDSLPYQTILQTIAPTPIFDTTIEEEDIAALIFTGGTTALPKAAQISHRMIAWNTLNTVIHDLHHDDTYLNVFPLFHTGGLFVYTLPNIILGGTTILIRQFDPVLVLKLIEQEQVTIFAAVPAMYQMLTQAANWKTADLTSLRFCTSGGAPLPVPLIEKYTAEKAIRFKQGFGMTEFGPGIFALAAEDAIEKAGSIGRPNFYIGARVVDDENRPLPAGEIGELVLKGPSQSSGYFNNPEETAAAIDPEGWFHTGDLAMYDDEWYFYIKDRKKDMFISGGENVYPAEIEAALYEHTAVHQCAVIGLPNQRWGEVGLACVVLKPGTHATEADLLAYLKDNIAPYKVPKRIEILNELPISAAGKILKRELKQQYG